MSEATTLNVTSGKAGVRQHLRALNPAVLPLALLALIVLINPVGYRGGGADDWHYLEAAECWAASGPCLPESHWWARWPVVAPMAGAIALFGESRLSVGLAPLAYAVAAMLLLTGLARRLFGASAAVVAGLAFAATPLFFLIALRPNADVPELVFLLAGFTCWLRALDLRSGAWAGIAGLAFALAVQTRETAAVALLPFAVWFLLASPGERRILAWAALGFGVPIAAEMLFFALSAGDPLLRLHLAFGHVRIPSDELAPWVDTSRSPLLNPQYIAGWKPANGIEAPWIVSPVLNLLTHREVGGIFLAVAALGLLYWRRSLLGPTVRVCGILLAATSVIAILLIYGLAVDPKPRMFLPLIAACALVTGFIAVQAWKAGHRPVIIALALVVAMNASLVLLGAVNLAGAEAKAARWLGDAREPVTLSQTTRRQFALVPAARVLPVDDAHRPLLLALRPERCPARAVRAYSLREDEPLPLQWARRAGLKIAEGGSFWLCLERQPSSRRSSGSLPQPN